MFTWVTCITNIRCLRPKSVSVLIRFRTKPKTSMEFNGVGVGSAQTFSTGSSSSGLDSSDCWSKAKITSCSLVGSLRVNKFDGIPWDSPKLVSANSLIQDKTTPRRPIWHRVLICPQDPRRLPRDKGSGARPVLIGASEIQSSIIVGSGPRPHLKEPQASELRKSDESRSNSEHELLIEN